MGRELYDTEPSFRQHVDECCALLRQPLGFDLREVLYPGRRTAWKPPPRASMKR